MIFGDDIITALVAIQMSDGGGTSAVITPLTVTENGTYTATDYGCDGFDPVNVQVPDRYDEGYADGYNDGYDAGYTEGYDAGHTEGYNDGYEFANSFYNGVVDDTKKYTIVLYFDYSYSDTAVTANVPWYKCAVYYTADMSEVHHFNYWPTDIYYCANPRFTKVGWTGPNNSLMVEVESTDDSGNNKARYSYHFNWNNQLPVSVYNSSNSNVIYKTMTE